MANIIEIKLDSSQANTNLQKFNDSMSDLDRTLAGLSPKISKANESLSESSKLSGVSSGFIQKLKGSFDDTAKSVFNGNLAFSIFTKTLSGAKDFLLSSIDAAAEAEQSLVRLRGSLIGTNEATDENIKSFEAFSKEIQSITKYDDDLVLSQIAVAKNFGLTNEESKKLVKSATEVAAVLGTDLASATDSLLKSLNGEARALKLLGPEFRNLTEEQLKNGAAIDLVLSKFGGQAENQVKSFSGSIAQLGNAYENLKESIGGVVTGSSIIQGAISSTAKFFDLLNETINPNKQKLLENYKAQFEILKKTLGETDPLLEATKRKIAELNAELGNTGNGNFGDDFKKEINDMKKAMADASAQRIAEEEKTNQAMLKEREKLSEKLKNVGLSQLEILKKERDERLVIAGNDAALRLKIERDFQDQKAKIQVKANENQIKESDKVLKTELKAKIDFIEKLNNQFSEGAKNPFQAALGTTSLSNNFRSSIAQNNQKQVSLSAQAALFKQSGNKAGLDATRKQLDDLLNENKEQKDLLKQSVENARLGAIAGGINSVLQGASGAKSAISGVAQLGLTAAGLPPQLAQALGPAIEALMGGPEAVRGLVRSFAEAVPSLIENLILAIPALVEELANQFPLIIDRLVQDSPRIINGLIEQLPTLVTALASSLAAQAPFIATEFVTALVKEAPRFVSELIKAIPSAAGGAIGGASGGIGGVFKKLKFAEGGQAFAKEVPSGFLGDSFPARLTSGELVVDRSTAFKLKDFLKNPQLGSDSGNSELIIAMLSKIMEFMSKPNEREINLTIGERQLAQVILDLNRGNQRLT